MLTTPVPIVSEHHSPDNGSFYYGGGRRDPDPVAYDALPYDVSSDGPTRSFTVKAGDSLSGRIKRPVRWEGVYKK